MPNMDLFPDLGILVKLKSDDDPPKRSRGWSTHKSACLGAIQFLASNKYIIRPRNSESQRRILLWVGDLSVGKVCAGVQ